MSTTQKLLGGVIDGKLLKIFPKEGQNTWRHSYSLDESGLTIDDVDGSTLVEFRVKDLKTQPKQWEISHGIVGGEVRPIEKLRTVMIGGDPHSVRGWRITFPRRDPAARAALGTGVKWLTKDHTVNSGTELEAFFETEDIEGLWKRARELVRDSHFAPRVRVDCAQVRCMVATQNGQLRAFFDGEGATALEDAIQYAARQTICNKATYLPGMKTNKWFLGRRGDGDGSEEVEVEEARLGDG